MDGSIFTYHMEEGREEGRYAVVDGLTEAGGRRRHLEVPAVLEGLPVLAIAGHAFSGNARVRTISLPPGLRSVGAFAFRNCASLEEIALYDAIRDFHNGVVRQDVRLRQIRLQVRSGDYTVMRDILSDTDVRLCFHLCLPDGEARLHFPGYDYTFAENTMARTIQFSILGSGMEYRECVRRRGISYREYDRLFRRVIHDDGRAALDIAADRLLYPYDLAPAHRESYASYLRDKAGEALLQFAGEAAEGRGREESRDEDPYARLRLMAARGWITGEAADGALRFCADHGMQEACGILFAGREAGLRVAREAIEERQAQGRGGRPGDFLSLEDW